MLKQSVEIPVDFELDIIKATVSTGGKKGDWIVEGYATTSDVDLVGDVISPEAMEMAKNDLLERSTVLHNHHVDEEVGRIMKVRVDAKGLWIRVFISKTALEIWTKIKEGVLNKFSIRAKVVDAVKRFDSKIGKVVNYVKKLKIIEASIVSVPVNAEAQALSCYVKKALEEFEMDKGTIEKDPLDVVMDEMEEKGLLGNTLQKSASDEESENKGKEGDSGSEEGTEKEGSDETGTEGEASGEGEGSKEGDEEKEKAGVDDSAGEGETEKGTKDKDTKKQDAHGAACPHYKKEKCTVKNLPKPGEVPPEAKKCALTKQFTCPFLKAAKSIKEEEKEAAVQKTRGSIKDMIRKLMKAVLKDEFQTVLAEMRKGMQESLDEVKKIVDEGSVKTGTRLKDLDEKVSTFDKLVTKRKSVDDGKSGDSDDDFWKGALPF